MLERSIVAFAQVGAGWVLWLLVFLSIVSIAVMIERAIFFARRRTDIRRLTEELGRRLDAKDIAGALAMLSGQDGMEAEVLKAGLGIIERGRRAVSETMDAEMVRQKVRFDANLIFLGTLGNNAPFIGLFGTVLGIIKAFRDLAIAEGATGTNAQVVMAGISEALVATAVGLAVALPAVVAFNYFKTLLKRTVSNTETLSKTVAARLDSLCRE